MKIIIKHARRKYFTNFFFALLCDAFTPLQRNRSAVRESKGVARVSEKIKSKRFKDIAS